MQQSPSAGEDLVEGKWLDYVVVGAAFQASHFVRDSAPGREHEDWYSARLAQVSAYFQPIDTRQRYVQNDQIDRLGAQRLQSLLAAFCEEQGVTFQDQPSPKQLKDLGIVVDQQNTLHRASSIHEVLWQGPR